MRIVLAAVALCAALAACARGSDPKFPDIAQGTPYAQARERMIGAGFIPQRIAQRSPYPGGPPQPADWCPADDNRPICEWYPELMSCSDGMHQGCRWLYRAGERGRYAVVMTRCLDFESKYCFDGIVWEDELHVLKDYPPAGPAMPSNDGRP